MGKTRQLGDLVNIIGTDGAGSVILPTLPTVSSIEMIVFNPDHTISTQPISVTTTLSALTDVLLSSPVPGQVLTYDGLKWVNANSTGGSGNLPAGGTAGQILAKIDATNYNATWINNYVGTGVAGQVAFYTGTSAVGGSSNLFWDNTNGRLGIGTGSPEYPLHISPTLSTTNRLVLLATRSGVASTNAFFSIENGTGATGQFLPIIAMSSNWLNNGTTGFTYGGYFMSYITNNDTQDVGIMIDSRKKTTGNALTQGWIVAFASSNTRYLQLSYNGNMVLQNGGTFTDAGYRLDINGTGASTGALRVTGGNVQFGSATGLNWDNTNGRLGIGVSSPAYPLDLVGNFKLTGDVYLQSFSGTSEKRFAPYWGGGTPYGLRIEDNTGAVTSVGNGYGISLGNHYSTTYISGQFHQIRIFNNGFAPTSGTGIYNYLSVLGIINQTGGANGITRGLYVNPTLTAAADFRAIETTNGRIVFGNLPTSSAGLPTGALWNNLGVINIV